MYDALTSRRSYKARFTHDRAMEVMRQDRGRAFDPELFDLFEELMRDGQWQASADDDDARAPMSGGDAS